MRSNSLLDATWAPLVIRDATPEDYGAFAQFLASTLVGNGFEGADAATEVPRVRWSSTAFVLLAIAACGGRASGVAGSGSSSGTSSGASTTGSGGTAGAGLDELAAQTSHRDANAAPTTLSGCTLLIGRTRAKSLGALPGRSTLGIGDAGAARTLDARLPATALAVR
jgi:hypothetical protein